MGRVRVSMDGTVILSIETATRAGSVCLTRDETLLATLAGDAQNSQSSHLLDQIARVLDEGGVTLANVEIFAVATGPGSFTGLRIGLATVKAFAATLGRKCVGIQTLHAIAHGAGESRCTLAALPAGRGELFAQRLIVPRSRRVEPVDAPRHIVPEKLLDEISVTRQLKWAGEGSLMHSSIIQARAAEEGIGYRVEESGFETTNDADQWTLVVNSEPLAVSVARLALAEARAGRLAYPSDLQAIYVRPSDAEMNDRC